MKIGCISWSHRKGFQEGKMDVFTWMEHCKKDCGLDGVELWNNHFDSLDQIYLKKIRQKAEELSLSIYSVATKCIFGDFSEEEIRCAKQVMRDWLEAADQLDAPVMRISVAGKELHDPIHQEQVFTSLAEVVREGIYPKIQVGIENQEPGVVQNIADVKKMTEITGGCIKLILDNGSFLQKDDSYEFMKQTLPEAAVVHTKFFRIRADGSDEMLDYEKIRDILEASDYDGYLSIEYDSQEPAVRDVPKIATYLKKLFARGQTFPDSEVSLAGGKEPVCVKHTKCGTPGRE